MKFAERILLESTHYKLAPYHRQQENGERCALGLVEEPGRMAERLYPWISTTKVILPCECTLAWCNSGLARANQPNLAVGVIVHLFNEHVMQGGRQITEGVNLEPCKPWTLEQLADWINSVDPTQAQLEAREPSTLPEPEKEPDLEKLPVAVAV